MTPCEEGKMGPDGVSCSSIVEDGSKPGTPGTLAELAILLERWPADHPFEEVLAAAVPILGRTACLREDCGSRKEGEVGACGKLLASILLSLVIRYARYVPETFGTRLSPRLAADLGQERPGGKGEQQARFLGHVVVLGQMLILLASDVPGPGDTDSSPGDRGNVLPLDVVGNFLKHGPRGADSQSYGWKGALLPWAWLWTFLAVVDLGGCGAVLESVFGHPRFARALEEAGSPQDEDSRSEMAGRIRSLLQGLFPRRTRGNGAEVFRSGEGGDVMPACFPPPLLELLAETFESSDDGSGVVGKERPGHPLDVLAVSWLAIKVGLETGLLRRRHFDPGGSPVDIDGSNAFERLWRGTRNGLFEALVEAVVLPQNPGDENEGGSRKSSPGEQGVPATCRESSFPGSASDWRKPVLRIDSLWLNAYLLHRITMEMVPSELLQIHFPDRYLAVTFLQRFAELTTHVLWNLSVRTRSEFEPVPAVLGHGVVPVPIDRYTDALVELVDVYAHHVLEVPFEVHIGLFLRSFLESQALLYVVKDHYRDHLYHVIDVFLLGDFLLRCRLGEERVLLGEVLADKLAAATARPTSRTRRRSRTPQPHPDLWRNWCVAALCHDLGYPLLAHDEMIAKAGGAPLGPSLQGFVKGLREALGGQRELLEKRLGEIFAEGVPPGPSASGDHGAMSALIVHDNLREAQWAQDDGPLLSQLRPATVAIFLHGLVQRAIPVEDAPLAYFLAFCDEVQDWGRARSRLGRLARDITWAVADPRNWQLRAEPVLSRLELVVDRLEPTGAVLPGPAGETARADEPTRLLLSQVYETADPDLVDPIFLWISKARNFERLAARSLPWRPRLSIATRVPERLQRLELTYRDVLSRVARRVEELNLRAFVHHMARTSPHGTAGWQEDAGDSRWDVVVLDLEQLAIDRPLRAFGTTAGNRDLAEAIEATLREAEEGYRLRGKAVWQIEGTT